MPPATSPIINSNNYENLDVASYPSHTSPPDFAVDSVSEVFSAFQSPGAGPWSASDVTAESYVPSSGSSAAVVAAVAAASARSRLPADSFTASSPRCFYGDVASPAMHAYSVAEKTAASAWSYGDVYEVWPCMRR